MMAIPSNNMTNMAPVTPVKNSTGQELHARTKATVHKENEFSKVFSELGGKEGVQVELDQETMSDLAEVLDLSDLAFTQKAAAPIAVPVETDSSSNGYSRAQLPQMEARQVQENVQMRSLLGLDSMNTGSPEAGPLRQDVGGKAKVYIRDDGMQGIRKDAPSFHSSALVVPSSPKKASQPYGVERMQHEAVAQPQRQAHAQVQTQVQGQGPHLSSLGQFGASFAQMSDAIGVESIEGVETLETQDSKRNHVRSRLSGSDFVSTLNSAKQSLIERDPQVGAEDRLKGPEFVKQDRPFNDTLRPRLSNDLNGNSVLQPQNLDISSPAFGTFGTPPVRGRGFMEVEANVTKGAMASDRMTSESLMNLSTGIHKLSAQSGGDMKIRLKPEGMGELHLKIATRGNQVSLSVRASDSSAKEILESSLGSLKDSLAKQNLTLGKVEFGTSLPAPTLGAASQSGAGYDFSSADHRGGYQQTNQMDSYWNQESGQGHRDVWSNDSNDSGYSRPGIRGNVQPNIASSRSSYEPRLSNGRLDIRA